MNLRNIESSTENTAQQPLFPIHRKHVRREIWRWLGGRDGVGQELAFKRQTEVEELDHMIFLTCWQVPSNGSDYVGQGLGKEGCRIVAH